MVEISEKNPFELETTMRIAKAIQKIYGYRIDVVYSGFSSISEPYSKLVKSYGIDKIYFLKRYYFTSFNEFIISIVEGYKIFKKLETLEDIEVIVYKDIHVGDLVYDTYIRINAKGYSPKIDLSLFKIIVEAVFNIRIYRKLIDEKIKFMISIDKCYVKHGSFIRTGISKGIPVLFPSKRLKILDKENIYRHVYYPGVSFQELVDNVKNIDLDEKIDEYFKDRFSGNINQIDVVTAFRNKRVYSKEVLSSLLDLDSTKKNAVIMPHAFSDFPHIDLGLFQDYYQWLRYLLINIRDNDKVNWLIKPHPTSYFFNEVGAVEKLISELHVRNVKIVPIDMSTASIKDIADVILTVRGTSGLEFSTFGIPVLNAGRGSYSGYEFNIEPNSIDEYKEHLDNIDKIGELNEVEIFRAKVVFYDIFIRESITPKYLYNNIDNMLTDYDVVLLNIIENCKTEILDENVLFRNVKEVLK